MNDFDRFVLAFLKYLAIFTLVCVISILVNVIGAQSGSWIFGEVHTDYSGPVKLFSLLSLVFAWMET